jgi:hypothetical protein
MRILLCWLGLVLAFSAGAAERVFDFSETPIGQAPAGFRSTVTGEGHPGNWKVLEVPVPSLLPPLSPNASSMATKRVLAQEAMDPTDEHFPLLVYEGETYGDFTLTTRFKTVAGVKEQMAGIAFHFQNETNYYFVRASSLGNTFRFFKVINGERDPLTALATNTPIASGVWHELSIQCKGTEIRCSLNGQQMLPTINDLSFSSGKIAFWTKSDSVSYFCDAKITYTPHELPAQAMVAEIIKKRPSLLGLQIFIRDSKTKDIRLIASKDTKEVGKGGGKTEEDVLSKGTIYYGKESHVISVVLPLRDRNGDIIAAVRVQMKPFTGQTERNAIARTQPLIQDMQVHVQSLQDLLE